MLANWVFIGRVIHIFAGFTALSVGLAVIVMRKGTVRHKTLGKVFLVGLLTACVFSLLLQVNRYFDAILSYQAVLGIYLGVSGFLDFNKRLGIWVRNLIRLVLPIITLAFGLTLYWLSCEGKVDKNPALIFASVIGGVVFTLVDIFFQVRRLKRSETRLLLPHAIKMITAFIVMLSAFSSTSLGFIPTPYKETWPSIVGLPLLYGWVFLHLRASKK